MSDSSCDVITPLASLGWSTEGAVFEPLAGGVSSSTILVRLPGREPVVVKQALERLAVEQDWFADPARAVAEGHGLSWLHGLTPSYVPKPVAVIEDPPTTVLPLAPEPSADWRSSLLREPRAADIEIAATLRDVATTWHSAPVTALRGTDLDDVERVTTLRIDPFYRDLARIWPEFARPINACGDQLLFERTAIVHGDFTPKNILIHSEGIWVIDTEVCHVGNPLLDTASMTTHLILKSVRHRTMHHETMRRIRHAFLHPSDHSSDLALHVGVILGVRAVGRSPAQYLDSDEREVVTAIARALLEGSSLTSIEERWLGP